ncbi:aspartate/glutamate racemase family protein [Cognatiyoonia sp. IB215182]|uniref:aspartate/glutamate racemase family protein n=1 Tax=Cognatiyoonia sp. IB215182 TaxID=3097353 RepID=UPI002A0F6827|nr:amino acid racemase [Cognatiyoonia sp. IB215182]MDX8352570.1 amino acid racemase [Cognatiyoonia sp. IB215182]
MRPIGILGGMGPKATVHLMQRVIDAVPAIDDADHIPLIVDQNPQVPSRIARLIDGRGDDPAPVLVTMAQRLEKAGVQALAMPCNTAHHFAPQIKAAVGIPFLNMVELAVRAAAAQCDASGRVGVLCSPAIREVGLLDAALAEVGLEAIYPHDDAAMLAAIRQIKAEGPQSLARTTLATASSELLKKRAEIQLIACTEFSTIARHLPKAVRRIDTLDCLVTEILTFAKGQPHSKSSFDARRSRVSEQQY